jgi:hypothetical protein
MNRLLQTFGIGAAAAVLIMGVIAGSARLAFAQDETAQQGQSDAHASAAISAQPDKKAPPPPPIDIQGCWDGTGIDGSLVDQNIGKGSGWIQIDQKKKAIKGGKSGSRYEFLWDDRSFAYGSVTGKVSSTGFNAVARGGGPCRLKLIGNLTNNGQNLSGTYEAVHCGSFNDHVGTFDLPYNPSGCVFTTPP